MTDIGDVFDQVNNHDKFHQVLDVLDDPGAGHRDRAWLVGFLHLQLGLSTDDIAAIIHEECRWKDYDPDVTKYHIRTLCKEKSGDWPGESYHKADTQQRETSLEERYSRVRPPASLDPLNYDFLVGARWYASNPPWSWRDPTFEPDRKELYRTVQGHEHHLFFVDIDTPDIERTWQRVRKGVDWDDWRHIKFSGGKGFHLIDKRPGTVDDWSRLEDEAKRVADDLGIAFTDREGVEKVDSQIYHNNRLVRAYSFHSGAKQYSVPVQLDDSLDDVLHRASIGVF